MHQITLFRDKKSEKFLGRGGDTAPPQKFFGLFLLFYILFLDTTPSPDPTPVGRGTPPPHIPPERRLVFKTFIRHWSVHCNIFIFDHVTFIQFKICCCVQNVMKIRWFFTEIWRYIDFQQPAIYQMAAVRHLGIVLPPFETTNEVSVAGRSCLSNFMSTWYTDLKI